MRKKDIFEFEVHDNDGNYATKLITQFNGREIDTASCLAFAPKRRTGPAFFAEIVVTMCFFSYVCVLRYNPRTNCASFRSKWWCCAERLASEQWRWLHRIAAMGGAMWQLMDEGSCEPMDRLFLLHLGNGNWEMHHGVLQSVHAACPGLRWWIEIQHFASAVGRHWNHGLLSRQATWRSRPQRLAHRHSLRRCHAF